MKQKWKTLDFRNAHFKATSEGSKKSWREDRDFRCRQIAEGRDGFTKLPREVREVVSALRKLKKGIRKKTYGEE